MLTRISKATAKKRFAKSEPILLCPCKFRPEGPFSMACLIVGREYLERAEGYCGHPTLWEGTVEETAWGLMYRNWAHFNLNGAETGRYAHYFVES